MQATNQYKQKSNFGRKKLKTSMAEWLTHVSGVQIQVRTNLIHCVGIKLTNLFFRSGKFCCYSLGFAFYNHLVTFLLQ